MKDIKIIKNNKRVRENVNFNNSVSINNSVVTANYKNSLPYFIFTSTIICILIYIVSIIFTVYYNFKSFSFNVKTDKLLEDRKALVMKADLGKNVFSNNYTTNNDRIFHLDVNQNNFTDTALSQK